MPQNESLELKRRWIEAAEKASKAETIEELVQIKAEAAAEIEIGEGTEVMRVDFTREVDKRLKELFNTLVGGQLDK